jgi:hypothetical protein
VPGWPWYSLEFAISGIRQAPPLNRSEKATTLGANAIVGVDIHYETVGSNRSILMVTAAGSAVQID